MHCMPLLKWNECTVRLPKQQGPSNLYHTLPSYEITGHPSVTLSVAMATQL